MSRWRTSALLAVAVAGALAGAGCGRYGPPVRAHERAAKAPEPTPPSDPAAAADPADPTDPDQER
jgi:hypothetical protein